MKSFIRIPVQEENVEYLRDQARQFLFDNGITVHVDKIGSDKRQDFFAVVFRQDGKEHWWNDGLSESQDDVIAWETREEAEHDLKAYVLPNLALCLNKERIRQFQMNLNDL